MKDPPLPARIFVSVHPQHLDGTDSLLASIEAILAESRCQAVFPGASEEFAQARGHALATRSSGTRDDAKPGLREAGGESPAAMREDVVSNERFRGCDGWIHLAASETEAPDTTESHLASLAVGAPLARIRLGSQKPDPEAARAFAERVRLRKLSPPRRRNPYPLLAFGVLLLLSVGTAIFIEKLPDPRRILRPNPATTPPFSPDEARKASIDEEAALRKALEDAANPLDRLEPVSRLAVLLHSRENLEEARPLYEESRILARDLLDPGAPAVLSLENNYAALLRALGRHDEAEHILRAVLATRESRLGRSHPDTLGAMHNLAHVLQSAGKSRDAAALYREAVDLGTARQGRDHPDTLGAMHNLAALLRSLGDHGKSETLAREVLAARRRVLGPAHPATLSSLCNLADLLCDRERPKEAEPLFREAYEGFVLARGENDPATVATREKWRNCLESIPSSSLPSLPNSSKLLENIGK